MLFPHSRFEYRTNPEPLVLALSSDNELSEIRIRPFLAALLARGVIAGFQLADRKMHSMGWHKDFSFTHIWCHRNVSTTQYRFLRKNRNAPIIYDLDDLMTATPDFVKARPRNIARIRWCLQYAQTITTSTEVMKSHLLQELSAPKNIITLKNGHAGQNSTTPQTVQTRIIWVSGDHPFVLRNNPEFVGQLARIVNKHGYEMIFVGRFDPSIGQQFKQARYLQRIDVNSYREILRTFAGAIGFAPLPSGLSGLNQQFFDAKSDIKLLDFLSSGLVPVCTSTPPYARSELFVPELAAENADGLLARLDLCMSGHAGWLERVNYRFGRSGLLDQRRFINLSSRLDSIFEAA